MNSNTTFRTIFLPTSFLPCKEIILYQIGYLIDRIFGIRLGAVIFATFICLGKLSIKTFHQNL